MEKYSNNIHDHNIDGYSEWGENDILSVTVREDNTEVCEGTVTS